MQAKAKAEADRYWKMFTGLLGDIVVGGAGGLANGIGESAKHMVTPIDSTDAYLIGIRNSLDDIKGKPR